MDIIGMITVAVLLLFLSPFLSFMGGWISGWLIKITIGPSIVTGLSLVGLNLPLDKFPLFFGTLSVIACFFRTPNFSNK